MSEEKKVIVYSTNWCAYCKMIKQYLTNKGVPWIEKNIEEDAEAHKELMDKLGGNFRGVPVTDVNGTILMGFDRPKIDAAIKDLVK
ncbi:NrdH-redoxin [Candidatus Saccharibacteria bacterium]|nr:NrdH-redoxin [Candidatus Saccharibacteria bacterium]MCL1963265.1 NrdH-redoxin [Candidatus Saccharibacteria bacterium]